MTSEGNKRKQMVSAGDDDGRPERFSFSKNRRFSEKAHDALNVNLTFEMAACEQRASDKSARDKQSFRPSCQGGGSGICDYVMYLWNYEPRTSEELFKDHVHFEFHGCAGRPDIRS